MFCEIILAASCIYGSFQDKPSTQGHTHYGRENVGAIHSHGFTVLNGTHVSGPVQVKGSLYAENATLGGLHVDGSCDIRYCCVKDKTIVNGSLSAQHTQFQKGLSVGSQSLTLSACNVDTLVVRKVNGYSGVQNIYLSNGTQINQTLIVESGNGQIWLSEGSTVPIRVHGAKIITK
jgi:hypothetical protein